MQRDEMPQAAMQIRAEARPAPSAPRRAGAGLAGAMLRVLAPVLCAVALLAAGAGGMRAQELSALARLDPAATAIADRDQGLAIRLGLSQPVPWRLRMLDAPERLVLDFREVDFTALDRTTPPAASRLREIRAGAFRAGWSRLVLELDGPYRVETAELATGRMQGPAALLRVDLVPASRAEFAALAALPDPEGWDLPAPAPLADPMRRQRSEGPLVVVLDPGHGGIDPGAEHGGLTEAALMLTFARELKEALVRAGGFAVVLTRDDDIFVPLETRIAIAHQVGGDVFLSLHADAVPEGIAHGATVYTLSDEATDAASAALAERHDRDSLLAGVDLTGQDDLIASVLMDLARLDTTPRTDRLADTLVEEIAGAGIVLHRVPRRAAAFSVLKSPDIPSLLLELGYMSSRRDLERLQDPAWRARMAGAVVAALGRWKTDDAARAGLMRQ